MVYKKSAESAALHIAVNVRSAEIKNRSVSIFNTLAWHSLSFCEDWKKVDLLLKLPTQKELAYFT